MKRKRAKNKKNIEEVKVESVSKEAPKEGKKINLKFLIIPAVIVVLACAFVLFLYPGDSIARGVSVDGINVSNMTVSEAEKALTAKEADKQNITVTDESGANFDFFSTDINLKKDAKKTAEAAFEIGRNEGFGKNILTLAKTFFIHEDLKYVYSYDEDKLSELIYNFGVGVNGEQKDYDIEYSGNSAIVKKGQPGQSRDVTELVKCVDEALQNEKYDIKIKLESTEAPTPDADNLYKEICAEAKDAEYQIVEGKLEITPETVGRSVSLDEIKSKISELTGGESITINIQTIQPSVTEASISKEIFGYTLGKFSSSFASSSKNRADNVELAASKINGKILMPGEEFSYNKEVGNRTAANGFKEAPVYANGESVQGMGGGVCQVSSTLYSAVLYADLQVLERKSHSLTVSYVPKGQDATVAYGSIDFKFKNNTQNPIKISVTTGGRNLNIAILTKKPEVEKTVQIINTVTSTTEPTSEEVVTPGMKLGERKKISSGKTGYTVQTVRKVFEGGKEVKSEKMKASTYKMVPNKYAIGKDAAAPASAETTVEETTEAEEKPSEEVTDEVTEQEE